MGIPMLKTKRSQDRLVSHTRTCETNAGCLRSIYPSLGMRQLFGDGHNGPVTSQLIDLNKWPNYPLQLIGIYVHKTHTTKNHWRKDVVDRQMYNCVGYFSMYPYGLSLNGWHALFCIANNRHGVTITTHATRRHFLIWMTTERQPTPTFLCFDLKRHLYLYFWWTRQRIHSTLILVDRYLRLMGDKTIPDSAEPRLETFYPPFVAGIDLPHQGAMDSYNL